MMVRAPRLARFQSPTDILNGRSKSLPTQNWSYKLQGTGGSQYGLDTLFPETMRIDEANMALWIPVADGMRRDGVGDLLEVGGIDVERHRKNPLCLFDHGKKVDLPIGLFETRENGRYTFEIDPVTKSAGGWAYFYQGKAIDGIAKGKEYDHALFCEQTFDMACKRLIRGGSIGYQVKAARELQPDFERATPKGLHLLSILMLEGSLVVLPANMDTVGKLLSDGVCCGKSLSPYLVKSLEPYAPERKAMVTVPLAKLSKTEIPPAKWRPGVGAVKSVPGEGDHTPEAYRQREIERRKRDESRTKDEHNEYHRGEDEHFDQTHGGQVHEEKAAPLPLSGQARETQRVADVVNSRPRQAAPPKPEPPRMGSGFNSVRQKYRTKGHYGKSVVPRDEARRAILAGRHAGHQQHRAATENAIPERDTNYRRPDEIGAGRMKIPGKRPVAPNPTGPVGGRETKVPESKLNTKIDEPTVNVRLPHHKNQPSSKIDPAKARQMLKDRSANGKPIVPGSAQWRMLEAAAHRGEKKLAGEKTPDEKESRNATGRRLGIGPHPAVRELRGPAQKEAVDPAAAAEDARIAKPERRPRTYFQRGRKPYTMPPPSGFSVKVKALRAKYKSGKRELTHSGASERTGTGHVHETPMAAKPSIKVPKASRGGESLRVPGPEPSKGRKLPYADAVKKPTSNIPEPKAKKPAAAAPAAKPKTPYVPDADAMRQREAVVRHEQSRNFPKNRKIQRVIAEADRTAGVSAERRESHRNTRRIGAAEHLDMPTHGRWPRKTIDEVAYKSLLDEAAEQRAAILELNQRVVALARQFA